MTPLWEDSMLDTVLMTLLLTVCIITNNQIQIMKSLGTNKKGARTGSSSPGAPPGGHRRNYTDIRKWRRCRPSERRSQDRTVPNYYWMRSLSVAEKLANECCGRSTSRSEGWF
ncbi:hypothetical protein HispidOSU_018011 [Sigmodon hispidus]